ncbi:iron complex transport system substrate-binding protein [Paenibacillus algorifonticola]|uniref:Iron complex transport system substrate-binding protein n=1 Tax=Paenibacillus algorifonticola TaxID=684063 RepID=A0A1I2EZP6_9BACL|nr:ABC transporter substrate-binding protein [Paenibacillus algorifonticola]SFE98582.1 iron complex transport system substrate-binding protein [Paenibacillus algorifonticola]
MKILYPVMLALLLLAAAGCSQTVDSNAAQGVTSNDEKQNAVAITDFAGRQLTFAAVPSHIVALSNGEADIIYALGGTLVGRPTSSVPLSNEEAEAVEQIGSTHEVDLEKIAFLKADVVLGNNPMNTKDIPTIESIGAKMVLSSANSIDDIKKQITLFGELLQKQTRAKELIAEIDDKLSQIAASASTNKTRALLVYGAPGTFMAALPNSLSGNILEMAGGENIASDYEALQSYPQYAQLNSERIVQSNPQIVMIMTHGKPEQVKDAFLKEMRSNAAWNGLDAVKNNAIEVLPADLFGSNPGTRITDALTLMIEMLDGAKTQR